MLRINAAISAAAVVAVGITAFDKAHLANLAGHMAVGALLFLLWAWRDEATPKTAL